MSATALRYLSVSNSSRLVSGYEEFLFKLKSRPFTFLAFRRIVVSWYRESFKNSLAGTIEVSTFYTSLIQ